VKNRKPNLQKRIFNLILIIKSDGNARLHSDEEGIGGGFSVRRLRGQLSTFFFLYIYVGVWPAYTHHDYFLLFTEYFVSPETDKAPRE
jgi:hypothetical protein